MITLLKSERLHLKLKAKMLLAVLCLVVVPIAIGGIAVNHGVRSSLRRQAQEDIEQVAENSSLVFTHLFSMRQESLLLMAAQDDWSDIQARQAHLGKLKDSSDGWNHVEYWDAQTGQLLASAPTVERPVPPVKDESWFIQSLSSKGSDHQNFTKTVTWTHDGFLFAAPVSDEQGKTVGVLSAVLPLNGLQQALERMLSLPAQTTFRVITPNKQLVLNAHTNPTELTTYTPTYLEHIKSTNLVSVHPLPLAGWQLLVARDDNSTFVKARQLTLEIEGITAAILIIAFFFALKFVQGLLTPLDQLIRNIRAIGEGYSITDLPALPKRYDELGEVAEAFHTLAGQTEEYSREVIQALVAALETRDSYTKRHSERVALYAQLLAQQLEVDPVTRENILRAGLLHDIGKIGVPESILNKPGALDDEEWRIMRSHPRMSYEILREVPFYTITGIDEMVLQHHERWDGRGYPKGLAGNQIRLEARILVIADAFDAMTSQRVYRKELSIEQALEELKRGTGQQFDPVSVKAFLDIPVEDLRCGLEISLNDYIRGLHSEQKRVS